VKLLLGFKTPLPQASEGTLTTELPKQDACLQEGGSVEHNWDTYIEIARRFEHKAQFQDREDLRHSIILALAQQVERNRRNGDKPLTEFGMLGQALRFRLCSAQGKACAGAIEGASA
jgi:hypothetical protein